MTRIRLAWLRESFSAISLFSPRFMHWTSCGSVSAIQNRVLLLVWGKLAIQCCYRVFRNGAFEEEVSDISGLWADDLVTVALGCSFTFENALMRAGIPVRHIETGRNVPMFRTNIDLVPAGPFRGQMVVTMRPLPENLIEQATSISGRYPQAHGAPIAVGDPAAIGIKNLDQPDYGDPVEVRPGEVPVYWACGVTPQNVLRAAKLPICITHAPGHMLITDVAEDAETTIYQVTTN
jgi:uncharacterized protein YcsI (UPF0317 family)